MLFNITSKLIFKNKNKVGIQAIKSTETRDEWEYTALRNLALLYF